MQARPPLPIRWLNASYQGFIAPLKLAWEHRQLLLLLAKRDITGRTSGTLIGLGWLLLQPMLQVLGFWFLLTVVLKIKSPDRGIAFIDYFLIGILSWFFISEVLSRSLNIFQEFAGLYQRTLFPIIILPLVPLVLAGGIYLSVNIVLVSLLFSPAQIPWAIFNMTILIIWLIPFCYILALAGLFIKDVSQVFPFLISLALYLTPILYMPTQVPESMQWILIFNPIADFMALIHATIQGTAWSWWQGARLLGLWFILLAPAWVLYHRAQAHIREML